MMSNNDWIEQEINRRVGFKMEEFRTSFKNQLKWAEVHDRTSFGHLFFRGKLEAWKQMDETMEKEIKLPTARDGQFEENLIKRKNRLVDKLEERLLDRGVRDYHQKLIFIVNTIEKEFLYE